MAEESMVFANLLDSLRELATEQILKDRDRLVTAEELIESDIWSEGSRPSVTQLREWTVRRAIPCCKPGNKMLYRPSAVIDALTNSPRKRNARRMK